MSVTEEQVKMWVKEAIRESHPCVLTDETVALLKDEETMETLRTLGKSMNPNTASFLARIGRMVDQASFSIGSFVFKALILGSIALAVWLFFKKGEMPGG